MNKTLSLVEKLSSEDFDMSTIENNIDIFLDSFIEEVSIDLGGHKINEEKKKEILKKEISKGSLSILMLTMFLENKNKKKNEENKVFLLTDDLYCEDCDEKINFIMSSDFTKMKAREVCVMKKDRPLFKRNLTITSGKICFSNDLRMFLDFDFNKSLKKYLKNDCGSKNTGLSLFRNRQDSLGFFEKENILYSYTDSSEMHLFINDNTIVSKDNKEPYEDYKYIGNPVSSGLWANMAFDFIFLEKHLKENETKIEELENIIVLDIDNGEYEISHYYDTTVENENNINFTIKKVL